MHCIKKINDDLIWVGANDRRLAMFEGVYSVPKGVSYNSYLLLDDKTVLFDTVDKAVLHRYLENVKEALGGRELDYLVVQHMEPDHSIAISEILERYPQTVIVCNNKIADMIEQFYGVDVRPRAHIVGEGDTLDTGSHVLSFIMAPMVHWPEVMVTYDASTRTLFSADAFGCFGALNGALFADEVDFDKDYMDEARRYYTNIVGKYGPQVQTLLTKASGVQIDMICPLHGFVWRRSIGDFVSKYALWSRYEPEEQGVMIAYASVYGNTENTAEILSGRLRELGVRTVMFDVSVTPTSEMVSEAFRWSHLVFASTTYNAGIFISMEELLNDLVAHNIQNRSVAIIENGSWAATSGSLIREKLEKCKCVTFIGDTLSIRSSLKDSQAADIVALAQAIADSLPHTAAAPAKTTPSGEIDTRTMYKLSYGLFVLTARDGEKDNGCIINTVTQISSTPLCITIAVNKANYTHDMIIKTGRFNVSILDQSVPFAVFEHFGFHSGKDTDKFADVGYTQRSANGIRYIPEHTNSVISAKVTGTCDSGTHTVFFAEVTEAFLLPGEPSVTYQYYFDHIKPKPQQSTQPKKGYVCKICGYIYEGEPLPDDFICPLCKHGAEDFEKL